MISRRTFLGGALAMAGARAAEPADRRKLREFAYSDVRLTGGPLAAMHSRLHAHYLKLDEDRLLKVYRQRAGLPAPGRDMGGWYDAEGFVPGHLLGQFISGLSRLQANTGDREASAKARRLVAGYIAAFERDGKVFASPKASDTWACYVLDKYIVGLLDAASLAGIDEARALLPRVVAAAKPLIPDHTFDRKGVTNPPYDEPYVLPENLFHSWILIGDRGFLDLAKLYLLDRDFFDPLAEGVNVLPGRHGYSHVIALSSAAKAYEVLGDAKYLRALRNAWDMLEETQQYASGAWAPKESFVKPHSGELAASLTTTHDHFETPCCFYAHAKLARYLTAFSGESRYGDGLERVLFNTILGALDPDDDGGYFYYSDYQARARKGYYQRKWPCCAGTLLQSVADYPLNLYFHDPQGIYVNLYAASEVRWRGVKLTQTTAYPESEHIAIRVDPPAPADFSIHLRIPGWLDRPAQILLNGKSAGTKADRGTYATLRRRWRRGDTIELTLPFTFRSVPIDDQHPTLAAMMYGPLMLTAIDAPQQFAPSAAGLRRVPGTLLEFASGPVRVRPFYRVQREPYSTYFALPA
jgi:DUF1680 family protein